VSRCAWQRPEQEEGGTEDAGGDGDEKDDGDADDAAKEEPTNVPHDEAPRELEADGLPKPITTEDIEATRQAEEQAESNLPPTFTIQRHEPIDGIAIRLVNGLGLLAQALTKNLAADPLAAVA
jgi:hypothetical protein